MLRFDYDLEDILDLTLNAAEAAFLPLEEREALVDFINEAYEQLADEQNDGGDFEFESFDDDED